MTNINELTDGLVITKRFRSSNEFSLHIEDQVRLLKISYMEAVIAYCNEQDIDVERIAGLISPALRDKIQLEAEELNMIKRSGKLPL
jgi:hypothetical protein